MGWPVDRTYIVVLCGNTVSSIIAAYNETYLFTIVQVFQAYIDTYLFTYDKNWITDCWIGGYYSNFLSL